MANRSRVFSRTLCGVDSSAPSVRNCMMSPRNTVNTCETGSTYYQSGSFSHIPAMLSSAGLYPWIGQRQVLGHGEDLREVGLAGGHLLPGGDVPGVAQLADPGRLGLRRLVEEALARGYRGLGLADLFGGRSDLENAVPVPGSDHFLGQPHVGLGRTDGLGQMKSLQLGHLGSFH